jgi:hypothetical protein
MGRKDNIYDRIQDLLGEIPENLSILEQRIDADIQSEYYRYARTMNVDFDPAEALRTMDSLFRQDLPVEGKKKLLVQLASIDSIEAFRALEKFVKRAENGLSEWAALAYQENRLLLESSLLDKNQILISTGLGGKGLNIRYFTVLLTRTGRSFSCFEKKLLSAEVLFSLKRCKGELERVQFDKELCMIISLIPLKIPIQRLFDHLIEECNHYDEFLNPDCMITNVRILSARQIRNAIHQNRIKKPG